MNSKPSLVGFALGRALSSERGLNSVVLPDRLDQSVGRCIVERINQLVASSDPYPVAHRLVTAAALSEDETWDFDIDLNRMVELRFGDRLVVADPESEVTLETIKSTYPVILNTDFPASAIDGSNGGSRVDLDSLASAIVEELSATALKSSTLAVADLDRLRGSIGRVLVYLAEAYSASDSTSWNRAWFAHVDLGLASLEDALLGETPLDLRGNIDWVYAAFGLPQPDARGSYREANSAKRFLEIIDEHWSTDEDIEASLVRLEIDPPGSSIDSLNWTNQSSSLPGLRQPAVFRFCSQDRENADYLNLFSRLGEAQFFAGVGGDRAILRLASRDPQGQPRQLWGGLVNANVCLVGFEVTGPDTVSSPELLIDIPLLMPVSDLPTLASATNISVRWSGRLGLVFDCTERIAAGDDVLRLIGRFGATSNGGRWKWPAGAGTIALTIPAGDPLRPFVSLRAASKALAVPVGLGNLVSETVLARRAKAPALLPPLTISSVNGSFELAQPDDQNQALIVPTGGIVRVLATEGEMTGVGRTSPLGAFTEAVELAPVDDGGSVSAGEVVYTVSAESSLTDAVYSPIVAALRGERPSLEELPANVRGTLRGGVESAYRDLVFGDDADYHQLIQSMGHVILPSDNQSVDSQALESSPCGRFLLPRGFAERWSSLVAPSVPAELCESEELANLQTALKQLDLPRILTFDRGRGKDPAQVLPSQARLTERDFDLAPAIEQYLAAYVALVETAKRLADGALTQPGVFWASMPFSVSVWRTSQANIRCQAVLLSPLHPIRLAWLFGVEAGLRRASADLRQSLSGLIEGWNIPYLGPTNSMGRLMAVPVDNGPGEIFLGWSLMARVSGEEAHVVSVPEFAGNMRMPGSATSGISRGGVSRAIRDYRAVFPHVSTLSVDLAASSSAPRLPEIDSALIEEARRSGKNGQDLPGGIRVFDSLNRTGPLPDLTDLQVTRASDTVTPLVWTRYPAAAAGFALAPVDIRIVQDQGSAILVYEATDAHSTSPAGVMGPLGFRRLEVRSGQIDGQQSSTTVPALGPESSSLLAEAVRSVERTSTGRDLQVCINVPPEFFGGRGTRWTVSGETAIRPGAIPSLLPKDGADRTLWEWRPSFLDRASARGQLLERRPYVSITTVSKSLVDQISMRLAAIDGYPMGENGTAARRILTTLGIRGVGLSRLLAGKDERAIGAIGFALALELAATNEAGQRREGLDRVWDFVFPIDMCEQYLRGIAGDLSEDLPRKADLLLMRLSTNGRLQLSPVEIKVRRLDTVVRDFPTRSDGILLDAEDQVGQTLRLLVKIAARYRETDVTTEQGVTDRHLIASALGALVEACVALRMEPAPDPKLLRSALAALTSGDGDLEVARPVVLFLGNGPSDAGSSFVLRTGLAPLEGHGEFELGQFLANSGALAAELWHNGSSGPVRSAWSEMIEWAFQGGGEQNLTASAHADLSPTVERTDPTTAIPPPTSQPAARRDITVVEASPVGGSLGGSGDDSTSGEQPPTSGTTGEPAAAPNPPIEGAIQSDGIRFTVGSLVGTTKDIPVDYWPSNTALNQMNIGVVGDLGTGKTELVKALVLRIREGARAQGHPVSFLILDYKGDYKGDDFLRSVGGTLIGDEPIPLDVFDLGQNYEPILAWRKSRQFVDVIKRIWRGVGPVQSERLETAVTQLFDERGGQSPTLREVSDRYRELVSNADSVTNVLSVLTRGGWFSSERDRLRDFGSLIGDGVLVVSMDNHDMDDQTKNTIAALFLNLYKQHMFVQKRWPFQGSNPQLRHLNSYILIDEAHHLMGHNFAALSEILLQGRQFGVGVILSSQFLSHFRNSDVDYREPLLTWFIHKVPALRGHELRDLGIDDADTLAAEVPGLQTSYSVYKSLGTAGRVIRETPYWKILAERKGEA